MVVIRRGDINIRLPLHIRTKAEILYSYLLTTVYTFALSQEKPDLDSSFRPIDRDYY